MCNQPCLYFPFYNHYIFPALWCKHVVLGLIFLRYISDAFEQLYAKLKTDEGEYGEQTQREKTSTKLKTSSLFLRSHVGHSFNPEPSYRVLANMLMMPWTPLNRQTYLSGGIAQRLCWGHLAPTSLDGLIDLVSNVALGAAKERGAGVLGHIFEYFLDEFSLAEGRKSRQLYTPRPVVELLVKTLALNITVAWMSSPFTAKKETKLRGNWLR